MKKLITYCLIFTFLLLYIPCKGEVMANQQDAEKEYKKLSNAKGGSDSIRILYNLYDLSPHENRIEIGYKILDVAKREGNRDVTIDMLNRLALRIEDTEALGKLLEYSTFLPNDSARRSVELIIAMETAKNEAGILDSNERYERLKRFAFMDRKDSPDIYSEILNIYRAMVYLGISSQGSLYLEYLNRLENLARQLPQNDYAIRNLIFSTAAIYYTRRGEHKKALEASNELLKEVELLRKQYPEDQRQYQTFDYFLYMVYRRMLENYEGMSKEEAIRLYKLCEGIASQNEEVNKIFNTTCLAQSYYNMAIHDYKEAVPSLRKALSSDSLSTYRRQALLGMLVQALDSVGDRNSQFDAMKEYIAALNIYRNEHKKDIFRELELRTDVNQMLYEQQKELEEQREAHRRMRKISITLVYVLAGILIIICGSYFKLRKRVKELTHKNKGLENNLQQIFDDGTPIGTHDARLQRGKLKG